jgi:hypothetical protein
LSVILAHCADGIKEKMAMPAHYLGMFASQNPIVLSIADGNPLMIWMAMIAHSSLWMSGLILSMVFF